MKRSLPVLLLLSTWLVGVSLICLSPPASDFSDEELHQGDVSQDSLPKLNLKNSNRIRTVSEFEDLSEIQVNVQVGSDTNSIQPQFLPWSAQPLIDFKSVFDFRILFRKFFETF
jgi:hypothetical protein